MREMLLRYHRLRAAVERAGRAPSALEAADRQRVEVLARRSLALEERVLESAEAAHCEVAEAVLEAALATLRERYADTPGGFAAAMAAEGLDGAGLRAALSRELRFEQVMVRVGSPARVSDTEVADCYHAQRARLCRPETREARHLLITINPDYPENRRATARRRMDAIAGRLRLWPGDFAAEAARHSECPTALAGGRLGAVRPGQLHAALDGALFQLAAGEISPVLESPLGWHLLLCESIQPALAPALEEVREKLQASLLGQRQRELQRRWLRGLARPVSA